MITKQILLVESDPKQLRLLRVALEQDGFDVVPAEDGKVALEVLEAQAVDLVLSATALPRVDGFELVEAMQDHDDWQALPTVLMIDGDVRAARMRGVRLGVEEFLTKPVFVKEMLARVHVLLAKQVRERLSGNSTAQAAAATLNGLIEDLPVIDLLESLEQGKQSGSVTVTSHGRTASVYFRQGAIVDATLSRLRGEEAVFRLLTWTEGQYDVTIEPSARAAVVEMETRAMLDLGVRQAAEFHRLADQLPPLDSCLTVDRASLAELLDEVPEPIEALLALLDGQRTILDVIDASPFDDRSTLRTLHQLFTEGVLAEVTDDEPPRSFDLTKIITAPESVAPQTAPQPFGKASALAPSFAEEEASLVAAAPVDAKGKNPSAGNGKAKSKGKSKGKRKNGDETSSVAVAAVAALLDGAEPSSSTGGSRPIGTELQLPSPFALAGRKGGTEIGGAPAMSDSASAPNMPSALPSVETASTLDAEAVESPVPPSAPGDERPSDEPRSLSESGVSNTFFSTRPPSAPTEEDAPLSSSVEFDEPVYLTHHQITRRQKSRKLVVGVLGVIAALGVFAVLGPKLFGSSENASTTKPIASVKATPSALVKASANAPASAAPEPALAVTAPALAVTAASSASPAVVEGQAAEENLPDVPEPLKAAMNKLDVGAYADAIQLAKAAIKKDPENADGYFALFTAYDSVGKGAEAAKARAACAASATKGQYKGYCPKRRH